MEERRCFQLLEDRLGSLEAFLRLVDLVRAYQLGEAAVYACYHPGAALECVRRLPRAIRGVGETGLPRCCTLGHQDSTLTPCYCYSWWGTVVRTAESVFGDDALVKLVRVLSLIAIAFAGIVGTYIGCIVSSDGVAGLYLFVLVSATLGLVLVLYHRDPGELGPILMVSYLLYALGHPLHAVAEGAQLSEYSAYLGVCLVGLAGLAFGYVVVARVLKPKTRLPIVYRSDLELGIWLTGLGAALSLMTFFRAFGGISGFLKIGYGGERWRVVSRGEIIGSGMEWLGLFSVLSTVYGSRLQRALGVSIGTLWAITNLAVGARGVVINMALVFAILWYYSRPSRPRVSIVTLATCGVISFVIAQYIAVAREYLPLGGLTAMSRGLARVLETPTILLPWRWGEFVTPGGALQELLLSHGRWKYQFGGTYLNALLNTIPGLNRLVSYTPLSVWRMQVFYPSLWAQMRGFGFFAAAEGYANLGIVGVFSHLAALGACAGLLYSIAKGSKNPCAIVLYAVSFPLLPFAAMRIDAATWLWGYTHAYLAPWILIVMAATFRQAYTKSKHQYQPIELQVRRGRGGVV